MSSALGLQVLECVKQPYQFEPYHKAIREPFDYYKLGNEFAGGVINREDSKLVGMCNFCTRPYRCTAKPCFPTGLPGSYFPRATWGGNHCSPSVRHPTVLMY